jgi:hypothetical protein
MSGAPVRPPKPTLRNHCLSVPECKSVFKAGLMLLVPFYQQGDIHRLRENSYGIPRQEGLAWKGVTVGRSPIMRHTNRENNMRAYVQRCMKSDYITLIPAISMGYTEQKGVDVITMAGHLINYPPDIVNQIWQNHQVLFQHDLIDDKVLDVLYMELRPNPNYWNDLQPYHSDHPNITTDQDVLKKDSDYDEDRLQQLDFSQFLQDPTCVHHPFLILFTYHTKRDANSATEMRTERQPRIDLTKLFIESIDEGKPADLDMRLVITAVDDHRLDTEIDKATLHNTPRHQLRSSLKLALETLPVIFSGSLQVASVERIMYNLIGEVSQAWLTCFNSHAKAERNICARAHVLFFYESILTDLVEEPNLTENELKLNTVNASVKVGPQIGMVSDNIANAKGYISIMTARQQHKITSLGAWPLFYICIPGRDINFGFVDEQEILNWDWGRHSVVELQSNKTDNRIN